MCKRPPRLWAMILTLMILLSGCLPSQPLTNSEADIYRQLHKKFSRMEAYSATVRLTVKSNKTENTYTMTQQVKEPDLAVVTLTEPAALAGLTTVLAGGQVSVSAFPDEAPLTLPAQDSLQDVFVNHFFSQYYRSEETALSVSAPAGSSGTLLLETAVIPGTSERYKLTMLCDTQMLEPRTITVYDIGGNIRMVAEFTDFTYNPSLPPELFVIQ